MKTRILGIAALIALLAAFVPVSTAFADDGETEFHGVIETLPATAGFIGDWVVSGKTVHVTASTEIDQEENAVTVGASVEVQGTTGTDGSITADQIDVQEAADNEDLGTVEFFGTIQSLPATAGFIGDWVVSGKTVHVTSATEIDQGDGMVAIGAFVEVKGLPETDGSVTAAKVEVKSSSSEEDGTVQLTGVVQHLPDSSGMHGDWRVSQHTVHVLRNTLVVRHGKLHRGATVRVWGRWRTDGSIRATKVLVRG